MNLRRKGESQAELSVLFVSIINLNKFYHVHMHIANPVSKSMSLRKIRNAQCVGNHTSNVSLMTSTRLWNGTRIL